MTEANLVQWFIAVPMGILLWIFIGWVLFEIGRYWRLW